MMPYTGAQTTGAARSYAIKEWLKSKFLASSGDSEDADEAEVVEELSKAEAFRPYREEGSTMNRFGPEKRARNRTVKFGPAERSRANAAQAVQFAECAAPAVVCEAIERARAAVAAVIERPHDPYFLPMLQARLRAVSDRVGA